MMYKYRKYLQILFGSLAITSAIIILGAILHNIWVELPTEEDHFRDRILATSFISFLLFGIPWIILKSDN